MTTYHGFAESSSRPDREVVRAQPSRGLFALGLGDLWKYRELLYFFIWRDLKVRYRQTFFGVAWALLQPLLMMVAFSIVLGRFARLPSDGIPYPLFVYAGLVPWSLFSRALVGSSNSLLESSQLIRKVYFPRLMLPIASGSSYVVDFAAAMVVLVGMMVYYRVPARMTLLWVPFFAAAMLVAALAAGVWLAAITVKYRDIPLVIPFVVQLWLFATPVAYPVSLFPENWRSFIALNPVAGIVEGFRWALLGTPAPGTLLAVSLGVCAVIFLIGFMYFRRAERIFSDWI